MITAKDFWNKRAAVYDEQVGGIYKNAYDRTVSNSLQYLTDRDRVLEFACGTGIVTCAVAPHVAQLDAIDISANMVQKAQEKADAQHLSNVQIRNMDLFDPALTPGSFDAVLACNVLLYVDDLDRVLARIHSLLKPNGVFLSATDCLGGSLSAAAIKKFWRSRTGAMPYVGFFTMKQLQRSVEKNGFSILHAENLFPAPPNLFLAARKKP